MELSHLIVEIHFLLLYKDGKVAEIPKPSN